MHIVDISALYSPTGGGIRTYTQRKLRVAERHGHRLTVVVPGAADQVESLGQARLRTIRSPRFPLDRSYFYFASDAIIHQALDEEQPDFIECSSPWGSSTAVADWPGRVPRVLIMHADPLSAWAYRYLDPFLSRRAIDRSFEWYWRHLRRCDERYDMIVVAAATLEQRMVAGGLTRIRCNPMGVEPGAFSPAYRDDALRAELLARCNLPDTATLLIGVGRHSPEKRWPLVIAAVTAAAYSRPIGLVLVGDGHARQSVLRAVGENPHIQTIAPIYDRMEFARMLASADMMVHAAPGETFGLACAEARASGLPIIVPDDGAAYDQLVPGQGFAFRSGDAVSLANVIAEAVPALPALRAATVAAAPAVRTIDEHFAQLFADYDAIAAGRQAA